VSKEVTMPQPTIGQYGTPTGAIPPGNPVMHDQPLAAEAERNWAIAAHLSSFLAAYVALGVLGPLVVMLIAGPRSAFVRRHAVEALNFNISVLIYLAVSALLMFVLIGFPMVVAIGVLYLVAVIRGAIAASRGEEYRYPLTIRFVR
jgi:uncharacterized Tic20 family protein